MRTLPILLLLLALGARAQQADTLTAADGWRTDLVASLAGNQTAFSNWQEGGVDAVAATAALEGQFDRVVGGFLTEQRLRLAYGVLRQDTLDVRKAVDVARYAFRAEVPSGGLVRPAASFSARTQFTPGFDYSPDAEDYPSLTVVPGQELKVSGPFAPLVMSQSLGIALRPGGGLVVRGGLGLKETVVVLERLRPVYGNAPDSVWRVESGLDAEVTFERKVMRNVTYKSRLTAFQGFNGFGGDAPDAQFENLLLLTVNDLLDVRIDVDTVYDADVSEDLQIREVLSVGLSVDLL